MAMFGALNRFISRLDSEPGPQAQGTRGRPCGFQVLKNESKVITAETWFDYVIGINGRQIDSPDPYLFAQEIKNCAGGSVTLTFWSAKGQQTRDLQLTVPQENPKIGLTLQWTDLSMTDNVWHILDVIPNSPADQAGLLPYGDYVIGTPEGIVQGESGLGELVEDYMSRPLRLWVYNHEYAVTRPITITPSRSWGGEGALGCVLGFGALHHLPPALTEPPTGPGDTLFDTAKFDDEDSLAAEVPKLTGDQSLDQGMPQTFTPSNLITSVTSVVTPPSSKHSGASRPQRKGRTNARQDFDSMWKEGEEKSKEEDFAPSNTTVVVPPPPKQPQGALTPDFEERRETASPAPILDDDDDDDDDVD